MTWMDGAPLPLYHARSGKRQHLPYHPVARFRGADSRPYYPYEFTTYNDFLPSISTAGTIYVFRNFFDFTIVSILTVKYFELVNLKPPSLFLKMGTEICERASFLLIIILIKIAFYDVKF